LAPWRTPHGDIEKNLGGSIIDLFLCVFAVSAANPGLFDVSAVQFMFVLSRAPHLSVRNDMRAPGDSYKYLIINNF
jgi:hypothetical protein